MPTDPAIQRVHAREVLDSRGRPTVEVEIACAGGAWGGAIAPPGASTGRHQAPGPRGGAPARHAGLGVRKAVANVREVLAPAVRGLSAADQGAVDGVLRALDPTPAKARLGANAVLG